MLKLLSLNRFLLLYNVANILKIMIKFGGVQKIAALLQPIISNGVGAVLRPVCREGWRRREEAIKRGKYAPILAIKITIQCTFC